MRKINDQPKSHISPFEIQFLIEEVWNFKQSNQHIPAEIDELLHLIDITFREINSEVCGCCICDDSLENREVARENLAFILNKVKEKLQV